MAKVKSKKSGIRSQKPEVRNGLTNGKRLGAPNSELRTPDFQPKMDTEIAGIHFQNPVLTASGTFGYGKEFAHLIDLNRLGGIVVKGISAEPMSGNPSPRIYETEAGMLNATGLPNTGAPRVLSRKLPF